MAVIDIIRSLQPKIVLNAPDGSQLWIDPTTSADASGPSLWPAGFKPQLLFGPTPSPTVNPKATDSPSTFFAGQSWTLLSAPGPLGVPWGLWGAVLLVLAALPYLPLLIRKKQP